MEFIRHHEDFYFLIYRQQTTDLPEKVKTLLSPVKNALFWDGLQTLWFHFSRITLCTTKAFVFTYEKGFIEKSLTQFIQEYN